jgi:hypothetical protein
MTPSVIVSVGAKRRSRTSASQVLPFPRSFDYALFVRYAQDDIDQDDSVEGRHNV